MGVVVWVIKKVSEKRTKGKRANTVIRNPMIPLIV